MDNFWINKRVFVVGGTGFIGSHLVDNLLVHQQANVKLFIHESRPPAEKLIGVCGDVSKQQVATKIFMQEFQPEVVFYLAAQPIVGRASKDSVATLDVNARGSYLFLDACKDVKSIKAIVYISTDKVYGIQEIINDGDPLLGTGHPYNASKVMGDIVAQLYSEFHGLPIVIIRNGNVYGPNDFHWDRIIPRTLLKIYYNESPIVRGGKEGSKRDYIFVKDLVCGLLQAAEKLYIGEIDGVVNLGANESYSAYEIVSRLLHMQNKILPIKFEPLWEGELRNQHFSRRNTSQQKIDWNPPTSLDVGLHETIEWYLRYFEENKNG